MSKVLPQAFFNKNAPNLAKELLGCKLVHESPEGLTAGLIVETEAYSQEDAASHSYNGETERTRAMFGPPGHAYIYFTYGMHYCFNVVSGKKGQGQGVLIRALQPLEGLELMKSRRHRDHEKDLCNGPAKLVQALGITKDDYGSPLFESRLYIEKAVAPVVVNSGPRIGITKAKDIPWRFWIQGSRFISR